MDRYGLTDAVCYIVCGASAFVTDVSVFVLSISVSASLLQPQSLLPLPLRQIIPDNCNPCWLPLSRRACILPIQNAYQQVYAGVFDYDGEKSADDFIGRVVIDVAQLRAEAGIMDITPPLREFSRVYNRKQLGSIRLRIQLNWATQRGERAALLAYLPRNLSDVTKRFQSPVSNPVTVVCPDVKSFQNIVHTIYGKDIPGKYKAHTKTALTREVKLITTTLVYHTKKIMTSTLKWKRPLFSAYVFSSWMYFVILCDIDKIPVWILSFIFIGMLDNYVKYHVNSMSAQLFGHRTIEEMLSLLLFHHKESKNQKSQLVSNKNSTSTLDKVLIWIFGMPKTTLDSWKFEDHGEFPFSNGMKEPKRCSNDVAARQICKCIVIYVLYDHSVIYVRLSNSGTHSFLFKFIDNIIITQGRPLTKESVVLIRMWALILIIFLIPFLMDLYKRLMTMMSMMIIVVMMKVSMERRKLS